MQGLDVRPGSVDVGFVEDAAGSSSSVVLLLLFYRLLNRHVGMVKMSKLMH